MGREVKRVSLDFKWPLKKTWWGYINPYYDESRECPHCKGSGYSKKANELKDLWYGYRKFRPEDRGSTPFEPNHPYIEALAKRNCERSGGSVSSEAWRLCCHFNSGWNHHINDDDIYALVKEGRLKDFTHAWAKGEGWKEKDPSYIPSAREVNEWSIQGVGHDSINCHIVITAECNRLHVDTECSYCKGEGLLWPNDTTKENYEKWVEEEPQSGPGYQMWETTSEGSPISPVFSTPEELARWLADNNASTFGYCTTTYENWLSMIRGPGWSPSAAVVDGRGIISGIEAMSDEYEG